MKFRKKPIVIDAEQWHVVEGNATDGYNLDVGYFRRPDLSGKNKCKECGIIMHEHGWIDTLEGGHIVCPGDWIITGVQGERYPCKPNIFEQTYEGEVMANPSVDDILTQYLTANGFAGLYNTELECVCSIDKIGDCHQEHFGLDCRAGCKVPCTCSEGCDDYGIGPRENVDEN